VNFDGSPKIVKEIKTQGAGNQAYWVKNFKLQATLNGADWFDAC